MRRRLSLLVVATTSLVLIAFMVPLGYLVRQVAAERALGEAVREAEALAPLVSTLDEQVLAITVERISEDGDGRTTSVIMPDGTVLGAAAPTSSSIDLAREGRSIVVDTAEGREVLVAVQGVHGGTAVIRTYVPDAVLHHGVARAWLILALLGLTLLGLGALVADRLAQRLIRPMRELASVSQRLGAGELEARVQPDGPPELRAVGRELNQLAARISELLAAERENVADLAHRLRTPLTALRLDAESVRDPADARRLEDDIVSLTRTVDEVINEARRPVREGTGARCDAVDVVRERVEFWSALADEEGRTVTLEADADPVDVRAGQADLAAALDALLGNVFSHTPPGTDAAVAVRATDRDVRIRVRDHGPGFETTDPFARGESAASTGLGLDIVRRTAESAGGAVEARSGDEGTAVEMILPHADADEG